MKRFEYKAFLMGRGIDSEDIKMINELGEQGWELVATTYPDNRTLLFKREINDDIYGKVKPA